MTLKLVLRWFGLGMHKETEQDRPHPAKMCGDLAQTNRGVTEFVD